MFPILIEKAYASTLPPQTKHLIDNILLYIVDPFITLLVAVAVIYFLWGVFQFIRNADSPEDRKTGQMHMFFGVLGIAIMFSAYGVINLILSTLGK